MPKAPALLSELDLHLATNSYMNNTPFATALDVERFEMVGSPPDPREFPHASRWFLHIEALLTRFPHKLAVKKSSMPVAVAPSPVPAVQGRHVPDEEPDPCGTGMKLKMLALHGLGQCKETFQEPPVRQFRPAGLTSPVKTLAMPLFDFNLPDVRQALCARHDPLPSLLTRPNDVAMNSADNAPDSIGGKVVLASSPKAATQHHVTRLGTLQIGNLKQKDAKVQPGVTRIRVDRKTVFGNPFPMGKDGEDEQLRDAACNACEELLKDPLGADADAIASKYRLCVDKRFRSIATRQALFDGLRDLEMRIRGGESLCLMCWCYPKRCHGNSIINMLRERLNQSSALIAKSKG
mmetsp:Transcript_44584/g.83705  ORF Transcript_44584/g.83705 Transcript_44584/m.83705 type:complete len:350 (+) Transcript_44584:108-1157(+)